MFNRLFKRRPAREQSGDDNAEAVDCIEGPVEQIGDQLVLRIPLAEGGDRLVACTKGIGHIEGHSLEVLIPGWLATKLGIAAGSRVVIGRKGRKCALWPAARLDGELSGRR